MKFFSQQEVLLSHSRLVTHAIHLNVAVLASRAMKARQNLPGTNFFCYKITNALALVIKWLKPLCCGAPPATE